MSKLIDENKNPVPICNVVDEHNHTQFYVKDPDLYLQNKKDRDTVQNITLAGMFVFILLLCIFTLNLGAAGWTAGNILTFGLVITALYVITLYGKKWMIASTNISQIMKNGNPCIKREKDTDTDIVYCKK